MGSEIDTPWFAEAKWHPNGMPANMAAILHDQWKRTRRLNVGFSRRSA